MQSEEELQRRIEAGDADDQSVDAIAYRKVFTALNVEPKSQLSSEFEDRILLKIATKSIKEHARDKWWIATGIFSLAVALIVTAVMVDFMPTAGVFTYVSGHWKLFAFAAFVIAFFQYIDRTYIRKLNRS